VLPAIETDVAFRRPVTPDTTIIVRTLPLGADDRLPLSPAAGE
jgi:hypothetical protein